MWSSREGRSRHRSGSQKGEQDAPKGPQPPSRSGEGGYGPSGSGKVQRVHERTEVRSCEPEAELAVVHFRFVPDNGSAAGDAIPQGEEPASCHAASIDLRVERTLPAEIIQVKKTRMVPVFRCLAVETEVSQYCGHSSAVGVMQFF